MGYISQLGNRIRDVFRREPQAASRELAKGATTSSALVGYGRDMLLAYGYDVVSSYLTTENDLLTRYSDYENMDDDPLLSTAIDIFSDDATQPNPELKRTMWVDSKDRTVKDILDRDLFQRTLRMDEEAWPITRTVAKYGNNFEEILVGPDGVMGLNYLPPPTVRRIEGPRGELYGFIQDFRGKYGYNPHDFHEILRARFDKFNKMAQQSSTDGAIRYDRSHAVALEDWEVVHFRLHGKHRRSIYGVSLLEASRWIWKRLMLLEDAALLYRLQRAPERFAFYVDVGDLPPAEALAFVNRVRQMYKKKRFFDPGTGRLNVKWEPLTSDDDFFIPVRKGQEGARIEVLGAPSWQQMDDIEYFLKKILASLKIPRSYLAQEQGVGRQILSSQDIQFARTVLRLQREIKNGMSKVCRVHLAAIGINPAEVDYEVNMTMPSAIYHLAQIEVQNARADLAGRLKEFVSEYWILSRIFDMSDDDIIQVRKEREEDQERNMMAMTKAQVSSTKYQQRELPPPPMMPGQPGAPGQANAGQPAATPQLPQSSESVDALVRNLLKSHNPQAAGLADLALRSRPSSGNWERDLMAGDREAEKRADGKLDELLSNDRRFAMHFRELGGLLRDLRSSNTRANGALR